MNGTSAKYRLTLLGPFGLFAPGGDRIEVSSKRGMALIALLATARDGVRTRGWLQDILWGSRGMPQAQASLRRELSNLRQVINRDPMPLLVADHYRVSLDMDRLDFDVRELESGTPGPRRLSDPGQFLEGLDIAGEEGFEDWLRLQRGTVGNLVGIARARGPAQYEDAADRAAPDLTSLPPRILDQSRQAGGIFDRPVLAVLPCANLTGDRGNDYLAEGIAEDLIERLARLRWLPIIARAASFAYSTESSTPQEIGLRLGARYLVESRLRGEGSRLALATNILDAEHNRILWACRREFPIECPSTELSELEAEIVGALSAQVDDAEMIRAVSRPQSDLNVNDLIWRARWHHNQYTREHSLIAEQLLQEALAKEPHSPEAIIQLADFRQRQIWLERGDAGQVVELRRLAQRAIAADYQDGRGYLVAGIAELWLRHTKAAFTLLQHALELNPSLAYAYSQMGAAHYLNGEPEAAIAMLTRALRLNMSEQHVYYVLAEIAMARAMLRQWQEAIEAADQALIRRSAYWYAHVVKIHALVESGDKAAARAARQALHASKPGFDPSFIDWVPFVDRIWPERLKQSLLTAGADRAQAAKVRTADD